MAMPKLTSYPQNYNYKAVTSRSPLVREIFRVPFNEAKVSRECGWEENKLWTWRTGRAYPKAHQLEAMAAALGYELVWRKKT